jgi:hypothetical protein
MTTPPRSDCRMNSKQRKTLQDIFTEPVSSAIPWRDIENLFFALGAVVKEGAGSRVNILLNGRAAVFHRPHPQKETNRGAVKSVRRFLTEAGIKP